MMRIFKGLATDMNAELTIQNRSLNALADDVGETGDRLQKMDRRIKKQLRS
jgi:hypothetical protein